tara:strand:+ start:523 stop:1818 length:1296 start_codon:yes stop_codon:yes gene_type:complete
MATINSYPTATPTGSDLIIGTDVSTTPNSTKTFTIDSINALTPQGTVTSVALTMPAGFSVAGSPITSAGTFAVTGAGSTAQFIDGTGALQTIANLPFVDGTGVANRVPFFVDADTISSSGLTYTTTGGGSGGNLPLFNFKSAGNADISTQRVLATDYFGSTLNIDNIVAGGTGTVTLNGNTIIGNANTDTLTVNATSSFAADATFAAAADIVMSNTSKILLGTTMTIEHPLNGNAIISEVGGGNLSLFSDDTLEIKSGALGENYAKFTKDGPIELYYDNVKKFETTTTGVTVTGTQSSFSGQVTIPTTPVASTDAASKAYVDSQVGYSTYVARVSQTSTNAPVAVVISNNTGLTFTWSRTGPGAYRVTPSSAFVVNKTWIQMTGGDVSTGTTIVTIKDIGTAFATAVNTNLINGAAADNITAAFVEIRIYP